MPVWKVKLEVNDIENHVKKLMQIGWTSSPQDIGKFVIPDSIIRKPAKLTPDEFELIKSHTTKDAEIIEHRVHLNDWAIYEYAYDPDKAYQMIRNGNSGAFSPKLLKAFTEDKSGFERLLSMYPDEG